MIVMIGGDYYRVTWKIEVEDINSAEKEEGLNISRKFSMSWELRATEIQPSDGFDKEAEELLGDTIKIEGTTQDQCWHKLVAKLRWNRFKANEEWRQKMRKRGWKMQKGME